MNAQKIIDALNDVAPGRDVTKIIVTKDAVTIESIRMLEDKKDIVKKTKLCKELEDWRVGRLQNYLHEHFQTSEKEIEDLKVFERVLSKVNKIGTAYGMLMETVTKKEGD